MTRHVVFSDGARKELKKLDKYSALLLLGWIRKNLEGCADPRRNGKELIAVLAIIGLSLRYQTKPLQFL